MQLENSFTVPSDTETAWQTLLNVEAIAPCMPGATLESVDGDDFSGNVKVKLGPVSMVYGGTASFLSKDESRHTAVIKGTGKEKRGTGTAQANVSLVLTAEDESRTRVDVTTDLMITGKAAQFGRGVMQDVASRLVDQFASNLETVIAARSGGTDSSAADGPSDDPAGGGDSAAVGTSEGSAAPPASPPAPIQQAEALDLGSVAAAPVLKRVVPVAVGIVVVVALIWWVVR
ncbi:MAG: SRPBCC family protein [Actinomycetia bacterium]|nr:SRPBCC family protein [Actinomycetes bacterium]